MMSTLTLTLLIGCLPLISTQSEVTLHKKEGDDVTLQPGSSLVTGPITSIVWRDGPNIAMQWDKTDPDIISYRQFNERGILDVFTGAMTIKQLTRGDSALYTPYINNAQGAPIHLIVISPLPVPTVSVSCNDEKSSCTLTCEGNIIGAGPVTYNWKMDNRELINSTRKHNVTKEESLSIKEFSCELDNPVSKESSGPVSNPFISATAPPGADLNITAGLAVCISLVTAVVLLAIIHRFKAGMWFFQKASMPWELDFWRKHETTRGNDTQFNGITAHQNRSQADEETAMTG